MTYDSPFSALGEVEDTGAVRTQVADIVASFAPEHDFTRVASAFDLMERTFSGNLPGYQKLQALYHNRSHTNEVVLCSARMLHGLHLGGKGLDADHIDAALIGALMHDIGYVMSDTEADGRTGAQFTDTHVLRGVAFTRLHLAHLPVAVMESAVKVILVTDHRKHPEWVTFDSPMQQRAAYATATADLVGQMANRAYLERLLFLYFEFEEAKLGGFTDIHDLLEKTTSFYRIMQGRMENDLGGLATYLARHFESATGEPRNYYLDAIDRNLTYLDRVVHEGRERRLEYLKRGGVVEKVLDLKKDL